MTPKVFIDINCDLGEGYSHQDCQKDALLMPFISSCNIACGGHAGNDLTIRESLLNAEHNGLKIGAHPGYPDKENFGRKSIQLSKVEIEQTLRFQIDKLLDVAEQLQITVQHIKLHGALYNDVEKDPALAFKVATLIQQFYSSKKVLGLAGGELARACSELELDFIAEAFIDRSYQLNGQLTPRNQAGSLITDQQKSIDQAIALATKNSIISIDGYEITPNADSICLHGDNPQALTLIKGISKSFKTSGIAIQ